MPRKPPPRGRPVATDEQRGTPEPALGLGPLRVLREAVRAVPAVKYALGVSGVVAAVAIVGAFGIGYRVAVVGAVITFVLMVVLVIFARLTTTAHRRFEVPVLVLMWSSLVLTILTAFLLLGSVFFSTPIDLRGWLLPDKAPRTDPAAAASAAAAAEEGRSLLGAAKLQAESADYPGAWRSLQRAGELRPPPAGLVDARVRVAMAWMRDMRATSPHTLSEYVDPLVAALASVAETAKGTEAADILAHIGWGYFLKSLEGSAALAEAERYFKRALELDPANPYAHAMYARWTLESRGSRESAKEHFRAGLAAGRDHEFVRNLQLSAWHGRARRDDADAVVELIRALDDVRRSHEPLEPERRWDLAKSVYFMEHDRVEERLAQILEPKDHLTTFLWLAEAEGSDSDSSVFRYWRARLTEAVGDTETALAYYHEVAKVPFVFGPEITAGIARCEEASRRKTPES